MTLVSSSVAPLAMSGEMTCLHALGRSLSGFLSLVVIDRIGFGGQYLPLAARVAYGLARVRGVVVPAPRLTDAGPQVIFSPLPLCRPIVVIVFWTLGTPSRSTSEAKAVLIDCAVAFLNGIGLPPTAKSFRTSQLRVSPHLPCSLGV